MEVLSRDDALAVLEDHQSRTHHTGQMDAPDAHALGYNPVCGDRYDVYIRMKDSRIEAVQYHGFGCVISKASASMMARTLSGIDTGSAERVIKAFRAAMLEGNDLPDTIDPDASALMGVRNHPSRLKCVLLPWHTATAALRGESEATTE